MAKITYDQKVTINPNPSVADINKGRAIDWNEVKAVVNANDDLLADKLSTVSSDATLTGDGTVASPLSVVGGGGGGVQSVTGDGVNNTDPDNPVLSYPTPTDIGLGNVDNTSDADKPISTATQTAINTNATDISNLDTRVGTNETDITTLENGKLDSVVEGTNVTIDNTDPLNPVINASGGSTPAQVALYNATTTGTVTLDCSTFDSWYRILTGNTDFQFSNTPALGETFVKNLQVVTTAGESLTFTTSDQIIGDFVNDNATLNLITISFANYPTVGLYISVVISS